MKRTLYRNTIERQCRVSEVGRASQAEQSQVFVSFREFRKTPAPLVRPVESANKVVGDRTSVLRLPYRACLV